MRATHAMALLWLLRNGSGQSQHAIHRHKLTLPKNIHCIYIRQSEALGLGHAILCARPAVGNDPFAVLLADDLLVGDEPIMRQLGKVYEENGCSILAVENVEPEDTMNYAL